MSSSQLTFTFFRGVAQPPRFSAPKRASMGQAAIKTKLKEKTTKEKEKGAAESSLVEAALSYQEICRFCQLQSGLLLYL